MSFLLALFLAQDPTAAELARLQGSWVPTAAVFDGVDAPAELLKDRLWVIHDDQLSELKNGRRENRARLVVGMARKLGTIDLIYFEGAVRGQVGSGIYKIDGDTLTVCLIVPGDRPTDFTAPRGSGRALVTFRREK